MPEYELETGSKYLAFVFEDALFRRKSCVTAIPIEAKAREVRIQARKVRSVDLVNFGGMSEGCSCVWYVPNARWSRATLPLFSSSRLPYRSANLLYQDCWGSEVEFWFVGWLPLSPFALFNWWSLSWEAAAWSVD